MKPVTLLLLCLSIFPGTHAQTYLIHANLVEPVGQRIIPDETIVYKDGRIINVGPSSQIKVPAGASVIDASGKWVMPGLVDAHVHFFQTGGLYTRPDAIDLRKYKPYDQEIAWYKQHMDQQLRRYLAAGITTVIDDGATLGLLKQRDTFAKKPYAPRILMAGPLLSTGYSPKPFDVLQDPDMPIYTVNTSEEALKMLNKEYPYKPDFIKIWYIVLNPDKKAGASGHEPMVKAIIQDANKHRKIVAVHATEKVTANLAVMAGAGFLVHEVEDEVVDDDFITLARSHGVVVCPTLTVMSGYFDTFGQQYVPTPEDLDLADPEQLKSLQDLSHLEDTAISKRYKLLSAMTANRNKKTDSIRSVNLKKMIDGGVTIATGTDAGNIGSLHASSYFKELRAMQKAGLTNWQIIQACTINGALAVGRADISPKIVSSDRSGSFGNIRKGVSADLLILTANPVDDLANLRKLETVIMRGVRFKPEEIRAATTY